MDEWKKSLIIRGQKYNPKELLAYSSDQIVSASTGIWEKEIYRFIINWLSDRNYIVQFSSGTTGKPKEVRLSKHTMIQSALNTCNLLDIQKGNTALLCMPVDFVAGKMMVVRCMVQELNMLLTEPKSTPDIDTGYPVDFSAMVPFQVANILGCSGDLGSIKLLLVGGAAISQELENRIADLTTAVYATYGMAETCSHIALKRLNGPEKQPSYKVMPGVRIQTDNRGCLVIEADYLPSPVISNDLVELTSPDTFNWLGRYDNLINSGGFKIVPEEVESMILEKTMLDCIAVGLPDLKLGQKLVLVFEKDQVPDSFSTLKTDLGNLLPRRWKPGEIIVIDKFPRNDTLKVDRLKLTEMCRMKNH
jgi:O-succinylbenzoic acid--CoA ligase